MAPFPLILGVDWLVKANINLICKDNQIVPVFIKDVEEEADIDKTNTSIPEEVNRSLPSEEFFQDLAKDLPAVRRKGSVRFSVKKAVEVPGESLRMLKGSVPIDFTGTGIVRFGFSAEPSKTWVVPSALVSFKNGRARVPLLNLESKPVIIKRRNCVIFIDIDLDAQIAVVPTEQKEEKDSNDGVARPVRMSCAAIRGYLRATIREDVNTGPNLSGAEKEKVFELLDQHRRCLPSEETQLGRAMEIQHNIDTGNSRPITSRPYRISQFERKVISEKVNEMLKGGVIQPSNSPWSSPVVLVKKKSGEYRFCIDYRRLNAVSKRDVYPL
ncbi:Histone-lysine N-methyltransferase NSD2, partial [Daphnia magna]